MEKHIQVAQLCLPLLFPKDVAILRCVCSDYERLRVSWAEHRCIKFELSGSPSAICWLHKNIVSIKNLELKVTFNLPKQLLQGLLAPARTLTNLCLKNEHIEELPPLPAQLECLHVSGCRMLRCLPDLPPTLTLLACDYCHELAALPASLSSTAVADLSCENCVSLKSIPNLPGCITHINANDCSKLEQLPQLPEGLKVLQVDSTPLVKLPELPKSIICLSCQACEELQQLPELVHTALQQLHCSGCNQLDSIPALPETLNELHAEDIEGLRWLPQLSSRGYNSILINTSSIAELQDPLPRNDHLCLDNIDIVRLPVIKSCKRLDVSNCTLLEEIAGPLPADLEFLDCSGCTELQQLPAQLPAGLKLLDCSWCTKLQQLPEQLPAALTNLHVRNCTALQQLPAQLPQHLQYLNCEKCSSLQELPDLAGSNLKELRIKAALHCGRCEQLDVRTWLCTSPDRSD